MTVIDINTKKIVTPGEKQKYFYTAKFGKVTHIFKTLPEFDKFRKTTKEPLTKLKRIDLKEYFFSDFQGEIWDIISLLELTGNVAFATDHVGDLEELMISLDSHINVVIEKLQNLVIKLNNQMQFYS